MSEESKPTTDAPAEVPPSPVKPKPEIPPGPPVLTRQERFPGPHVYIPSVEDLPQINQPVSKEKPVRDAGLQEKDIRMEFVIKVTTRHAEPFNYVENAVLSGLLDPANKGHLAKVMEERFAFMRDTAIRGLNRVMDEAVEEDAPPTTQKATAKKAAAPAKLKTLTRGTDGRLEVVEETKPPTPKMPPQEFGPPLSAVPPTDN